MASPDRLDSVNDDYLFDGFRFVCQACQAVDQHRERSDRHEAHSGDVVPLTMAHEAEILAYLRKRLAKARKAAS